MLEMFFKENVGEVEETKEVFVSDRFKKDGKVVKWIIKRLTAKEEAKIREKATVRKGGKQEFDQDLYVREMIVEAVKFPNLHSKELQDSYNVMGAIDLLQEMLYMDEMLRLQTSIMEYIGGNITLEDRVEEAKN